jgi:hypothetical protein
LRDSPQSENSKKVVRTDKPMLTGWGFWVLRSRREGTAACPSYLPAAGAIVVSVGFAKRCLALRTLAHSQVRNRLQNQAIFAVLQFGAVACRVLRKALKAGKVTGPFSPPEESKRLAAQTQIAKKITDAEGNKEYR